MVFVTGGSQGSAAINHAVSGAVTRLLRRAVVIHHTGNAHLAQVAAKRETLAPDLRERYQVFGFLREEMGAALASADLVVGRASSSSIAEPLAFGVPQRDAVIAFEIVNEIQPALFVEMQDGFRIGSRAVNVAALLQAFA